MERSRNPARCSGAIARRLSVAAGLVVAAVLALAAPSGAGAAEPLEFTHGVASGDVTDHRAVLWSRVNRASTVRVDVFTDEALTDRAFRKRLSAAAGRDFTLKVDANGLEPATTYYYRFRHGPVTSPVGTFETAPDPDEPADVRFTYTGDADGTKTNRPESHGNFEVLDRAREENGDFWVYLGDTIYSDSSLRAGPATTLSEYRDAYKENRTYSALTDLLASTSTYAMWDDHEVQNDFDGQTVDADRFAAGRKAFFEYMPIRKRGLLEDPTCAGGGPLYREFSWGSEVDIIVLDERSCRSADVAASCPTPAGHPLGPIDPAPTAPQNIRDAFGLPPPPQSCLDALNDPNRTMLGPVQEAALKDALANSTAKYKLVVNPVPIQQFYILPYDRWEGYAAERAELIDFVRDEEIEGVHFLTTDTHATLVNQVFVDREDDPDPVFDETVTGPISTFTLQEEILDFGGVQALIGANILMEQAGMDCLNLDQFSYGVVDAVALAPTLVIAFKDDEGAPVENQSPPGPICVYPPAPVVP